MSNELSRDRVREIGGWGYGLEIIQGTLLQSVRGTDTPTCLMFDLATPTEQCVQEARRVGKNWSIKFSCAGEREFTHNAVRGDNSSLGRTIHFDQQEPEFISRRVERVFYNAPRHTKKIIFQELIDLSQGFLIHADLTGSELQVESLLDDHRVYSRGNYKSQPTLETSDSKRLPLSEAAEVANVMTRLKHCKDALVQTFACEEWAIEGFWEVPTNKLRLLQLRPAPQDRPSAQKRPSDLLRVQDHPKAVFETGWVWGVSEMEAAVRNGRLVGSALKHVPEPGRVPYDPATLSNIATGSTKLIMRTTPDGASRLSHEPWFLPPPEYRSDFCHAWIPRRIVDRLEGKEVVVKTDGNRLELLKRPFARSPKFKPLG